MSKNIHFLRKNIKLLEIPLSFLVSEISLASCVSSFSVPQWKNFSLLFLWKWKGG
jgi:hypothetical protein